jgi:hypothetical protein
LVPHLAGLQRVRGWFEDDDWGAALRYRNTFADTWAVAASAGYEKLRDERLQFGGGGLAGFKRDLHEVAGSAAIKNKPTGLFVMGIWSISDSNDSNVIGGFNGEGAPNMTAWDVQGGIQRKTSVLGLDKLGETSFWGGYSDVRNGFAPGSSGVGTVNGVLNQPITCPPSCSPNGIGALGVRANMELPAGTFPSLPNTVTQVTGSDVHDWFLAFDQSFEAAAFHLYAVYQHFDAPSLNLIDINRDRVPLKLDGFDLGYVGGRIYF